jgi:glucoamylase
MSSRNYIFGLFLLMGSVPVQAQTKPEPMPSFLGQSPSVCEIESKSPADNAIALINDYKKTMELVKALSAADWARGQGEVSIGLMLDNVSVPGNAPGSVAASPSLAYQFMWIRDSALVIKELIYLMRAALKAGDTALASTYQQILENYVDLSIEQQESTNLSGTPDTSGDGEPKFQLNGAPFNQGWTRPQNDGPGLRAVAMILFARDQIAAGHSDYVTQKLYNPSLAIKTLIKTDLEFVANHWKDVSGDLWEEVKGDHFYTRMAQLRALREGSTFARERGDAKAADFYSAQAVLIEASLNDFFMNDQRYFQVTRNFQSGVSIKSSGMDVAVVLAAIHSGSDGDAFSVSDNRMLSTVQKMQELFQPIYSINGITTNQAGEALSVGIGRYPEDTYNGYTTSSLGNPWFLALHAMAEFHERLATYVLRTGTFSVNDLNLAFVQGLNPGFTATIGQNLNKGSPEFKQFVSAVQERGDSFLRRSQYHTGQGGHQSEQINRDNGFMQGSVDLTWNYASILSYLRARGSR